MSYTDIFGKEKEIRENELVSAEHVKVSVLNNGAIADTGLVQSLSLSYGQTVAPNYVLGSSDVWWVAGPAQGSGNMTSLVGTNGFFDMLNAAGSKCMLMNTIKVAIESDCVKVKKGKTLTANGVKITSLQVAMAAQQVTVAQTVGFMIGALSR